jgi:polyhydroxyalkanoate synthesis regulator phasin
MIEDEDLLALTRRLEQLEARVSQIQPGLNLADVKSRADYRDRDSLRKTLANALGSDLIGQPGFYTTQSLAAQCAKLVESLRRDLAATRQARADAEELLSRSHRRLDEEQRVTKRLRADLARGESYSAIRRNLTRILCVSDESVTAVPTDVLMNDVEKLVTSLRGTVTRLKEQVGNLQNKMSSAQRELDTETNTVINARRAAEELLRLLS